ncbi:MAG: hypothetical protein AAF658_11510 [Myxococcota bacterium]
MPKSTRSHSLGRLLSVAGALGVLALAGNAKAAQVPLAIKVIHATKDGKTVDPKLKGLVKDFKGLAFTNYSLLDEATFTIELGSTGRMQLPSKAWMTVVPVELKGDKLKLEIGIKEHKFKTKVTIKEGATLAVGGPKYDRGVLILAVTRKKP